MQPTETRILNAATSEFADHGIGGARVNRIAERARANKERLYHYFGDKEALFAAAVESARRQIVEVQPFTAPDLGGYVRAMLEFHADHPELIQLLLADDHRRRSLGASTDRRWRRHYSHRVRAVCEAQQDGAIRRDVDPRAIVYMVLALVTTSHAFPGLTRAILESDDSDDILTEADLARELQGLLTALTDPSRE